MTREEALALIDTKWWESRNSREIALFQFNEPRLCMPFALFHAAVEKTLGRPVWTHEFAMNYDGLKRELNGEQPAPSFAEILDLIPAEKRVVVVVDSKPDGAA